MTDFTGRRVAVIGAARSGIAVARALAARGASVHVFESKQAEESPNAAALRDEGVGVTFGANDGPELLAAEIVVPSPGVWKTSGVLRGAVERGQTIWSEPEVACRLTDARIAAVTGTNGKTTTTALLGEMLRDGGLDARVGGNISPGVPLATVAADAPATAVLVAEISSFQLEWVDAFRPAAGVITNITQDHLDRHGTVAEYAAMKARLLENQAMDDVAVVNEDNPLALAAGRAARGRLFTFSRLHPVERGGFVRDGNLVLRMDGTEAEVMDVAGIRIPGRHNLENALAAAIAAAAMGVPAESLAHTLTRFAGVPHRMEMLGEGRGVTWINNSMCTNPDALIGSLEALDAPIVAIIGGQGKQLDAAAVPAVLGRRCRAVLSIGREGSEVARMARAGGVGLVREAGTLEAAVPLAADLARPGDIVMLAPGYASMDQFRDFAERGQRFRELAAAWLAEASPTAQP